MSPTRCPGRAGRLAATLACLALLLATACRKRAAVPRPKGHPRDGGVTCPAAETLAEMVSQQGRRALADCVVYAPGFFWLGAALTYEAPGGGQPRLSLIYSGQPPGGIFELEPVPSEALTRIIKANQDLRVSIRKPGPESRLVRVGVYGQHGGDRPQADELVVVLRLVAHSPPEILWTGPGDEVRTDAHDCVAERTVDFEMPFGERLEMSTVQRAHRREPGGKQTCIPAPSTQQTVEYKAQALKPSRPLAGR
jgi:hypothetical protein